jgi:DNA topoisomerase-3
VTLDAGGAEFTAKGKTVLHRGWKETAGPAPDNEDGEPPVIPEIAEGLSLPATASLKEGETSPPKHFTEDTLLAGMETAGAEDMPADGFRAEDVERRGLGTPATRGNIIEKIVKTGFVERKKKNLIPTDKAKSLICVLPEKLKSPALTAEWEQKLKLVERGELDAAAFMSGIENMMRSIIADNGAPDPTYISLFATERQGGEVGVCPRCGGTVREGEKGFFCDNRSCGFKRWKASKFWTAKKKPLTAKIVAALLKNGRASVNGLYSEKTGKKYDAAVVLDDTGGAFVNFKLVF